MKLIVLDRLMALMDSPAHKRVLEVSHNSMPCHCVYLLIQDLVMDIVRVLSAADLEVRRKTLTLVMDLVSSRNIDEVGVTI